MGRNGFLSLPIIIGIVAGIGVLVLAGGIYLKENQGTVIDPLIPTSALVMGEGAPSVAPWNLAADPVSKEPCAYSLSGTLNCLELGGDASLTFPGPALYLVSHSSSSAWGNHFLFGTASSSFQNPVLAVDSHQELHVAYDQNGEMAYQEINYEQQGFSYWSDTIDRRGSPYLTFALDGEDQSHIAWISLQDFSIQYMEEESSSRWSDAITIGTTTPAAIANGFSPLSMAIDSQNTVWITWTDGENVYVRDIKDGAPGELQKINSGLPGVSEVSVQEPAIAIDLQDNLNIAWASQSERKGWFSTTKNYDVLYQRRSQQGWFNEPKIVFESHNNLLSHPSISSDAAGNIYFAANTALGTDIFSSLLVNTATMMPLGAIDVKGSDTPILLSARWPEVGGQYLNIPQYGFAAFIKQKTLVTGKNYEWGAIESMPVAVAPSSSSPTPAVPTSSPDVITTIAASSFTAPYPMIWTESFGRAELDLVGVSFENHTDGVYGTSITSTITMQVKVSNHATNAIFLVPMSLKMLLDESGDLSSPLSQFQFAQSGNGIGIGQVATADVIFAVPDDRQDFIFTVTDASSSFFSVSINNGVINVQKEPTSEDGVTPTNNPSMSGTADTRDSQRISDLHQIQNALELYYNKCGYYPGGTIVPGSHCGGFLPLNGYKAAKTVIIGSGVGVATLPDDPSAGREYYYATEAGGVSYILGATFEDTNNSIFHSYNPPVTDNYKYGDRLNCAVPNYCVGI